MSLHLALKSNRILFPSIDIGLIGLLANWFPLSCWRYSNIFDWEIFPYTFHTVIFKIIQLTVQLALIKYCTLHVLFHVFDIRPVFRGTIVKIQIVSVLFYFINLTKSELVKQNLSISIYNCCVYFI